MNITQLKVFYQNVNGLRTKLPRFKHNLHECFNEVDIVAVTETWLHSEIDNTHLCKSTFDVHRLDRDPKRSVRGGGVMLMVRSDLGARRMSHAAVDPSIEMLWVTIPTTTSAETQGANLHVAVVYAPPNSSLPRNIEHIISSVLHVHKTHPNDNLLVMGDFNLNNVQWNDSLEPTFKRKNIKNSKILLEQFSNFGLKQYNHIGNLKGNTLDLVFSDLSVSCSRSPTYLVREDRAHPSIAIRPSQPTLAQR